MWHSSHAITKYLADHNELAEHPALN